jgi:hypothetical protein
MPITDTAYSFLGKDEVLLSKERDKRTPKELAEKAVEQYERSGETERYLNRLPLSALYAAEDTYVDLFDPEDPFQIESTKAGLRERYDKYTSPGGVETLKEDAMKAVAKRGASPEARADLTADLAAIPFVGLAPFLKDIRGDDFAAASKAVSQQATTDYRGGKPPALGSRAAARYRENVASLIKAGQEDPRYAPKREFADRIARGVGSLAELLTPMEVEPATGTPDSSVDVEKVKGSAYGSGRSTPRQNATNPSLTQKKSERETWGGLLEAAAEALPSPAPEPEAQPQNLEDTVRQFFGLPKRQATTPPAPPPSAPSAPTSFFDDFITSARSGHVYLGPGYEYTPKELLDILTGQLKL